MVGLHVIFSRFKECRSGYWVSFAICKSRLLCQQIDISEPKCVHEKQTEIFRCHRDTNCLFWSWSPVHPNCRYGKIWYPLPTYDPMRGWGSRRDLLAWSMARNSTSLGSACARNGWGMPHENVGWNLRFSIMEICLLHHEPSRWTLGTSNAALATYWKRTRWTTSNELDKQIWAVFSYKTLGWLEERGYGCGPMDDGDGWVREILYKVAEFVSQIVQNFEHLVPVRALNRAAFSACEPQTQTQTQWS